MAIAGDGAGGGGGGGLSGARRDAPRGRDPRFGRSTRGAAGGRAGRGLGGRRDRRFRRRVVVVDAEGSLVRCTPGAGVRRGGRLRGEPRALAHARGALRGRAARGRENARARAGVAARAERVASRAFPERLGGRERQALDGTPGASPANAVTTPRKYRRAARAVCCIAASIAPARERGAERARTRARCALKTRGTNDDATSERATRESGRGAVCFSFHRQCCGWRGAGRLEAQR